jgi:hypothetical protein
MHIFDPCCFSSDLPGGNPTTNDKMILYCRLMTKVVGLGDSTIFSWAGCHRKGETVVTTPGRLVYHSRVVDAYP